MSFVSYLLFLGTKLSQLWRAAVVKCIVLDQEYLRSRGGSLS